MTRKEKIVGFLSEPSYKPLKFDELAVTLCVPKEDTEEFSALLDQLISEGEIVKTRKGRYVSSKSMGLLNGVFQSTERGFGFLLQEEDDVFIPADAVAGAMNRDVVLVKPTKKPQDGKRREGEVVAVLKRANETIVGRFEKSRNFGFVIPDDKRLNTDIFIPKANAKHVKGGDKVVVRITKWPGNRRNPEGEIAEVLGHSGEPGVDILSILKQYGLSDTFPPAVRKEAERIPGSIREQDLSGREDFRNETIITIDGADAKDLDDAISLLEFDNFYRLGVHIADVTHYVKENSALDKEAQKRGTSVYLVDRVVPMLPKKLSNGICSLHPQVDRLTLSVIMDIDHEGRVIDHRIVNGVIRTAERMTYDDVASMLLSKDPALCKRYRHILPMLKKMRRLSELLRAKRMKKGSIDFAFPETKIKLDETGKPVEILKYETTIANSIIEEFMLLCNKTVAEAMFWADIPFVYRAHERPSPEKITAFNEFLAPMGFRIRSTSEPHPKEFATLLKKVKGAPKEKLIGTVMLRSLMKARYLPQNSGHFGLAFDYYCHFTSPIRRYPDLAIHRIIKEFIGKNGLSKKRIAVLSAFANQVSVSASEAEVTAQYAERDCDDLKKAEYMKEHIGESYDGIISSCTSFGLFVELENTVEGLIRMVDLYDDYYIFDEKRYTLMGERTGRTYKIGDPIRVTVSDVNVDLREISFVLEE